MKGTVYYLCVGLVILVLGGQASEGAPGNPDPDFNGTGIVTLQLGYGNDTPTAVVTLPDRKLLIAGSSGESDDASVATDITLVRLEAEGALDPMFGNAGKVITRPPGLSASADAMRVQADGKIIVAGSVHANSSPSASDFVILRFTPDGSLDPLFGTGGVVITDIGGIDTIHALHLLPDGKLLVAGIRRGNATSLVIAKYAADGSLDASFGSGGIVLRDQVGPTLDMAVLGDGKIFVVNGHINHVRLSCFLPNGDVDASFGTAGVAVEEVLGARALKIAIQPGSSLSAAVPAKILIFGEKMVYDSMAVARYGIVLTRFTLDGRLDPTFDIDEDWLGSVMGFVTVNAILVEVNARGLAPRITMAAGPHAYVTKFSGDGSLDTSFGDSGIILSGPHNLPDNRPREAVAMAWQNDKLVVVGHVLNQAGNRDVFVTRFDRNNGARDITFGLEGSQIVDVGTRSGFMANALVTASDSSVFVGGNLDLTTQSPNRGVAGVLRYRPQGTLDPLFGDGGKVILDEGEVTKVSALGLHPPSGSLVVAGTVSSGPAERVFLVRLLANGARDPNFGTNGFVLTEGQATFHNAPELTVQSDGKCLVSGLTHLPAASFHTLSRYNLDGSLDLSFNGTGNVTFPVSSPTEHVATLKLQPDGRILVAMGRTELGAPFELIRLLPTGALDVGFGSLGRVITPIRDLALIEGATVLAEGKILATGASAQLPATVDVSLIRYLSNGLPDMSFGSDGMVTTPIGGGHDYGVSIFPRADGKILVVAAANLGGVSRLTLVRYLPTGQLDSPFGLGGKLITSLPAAVSSNQVAMDAAGRLLLCAGDQLIRIFVDEVSAGVGVMEIISVTRQAGGSIRLEGRGRPNGVHTLLSTFSLQQDSATPHGAVRPDAAGNWFFEDTEAPSHPRRFYWMTDP